MTALKGVERMSIDKNGIVQINGLSSAGVIHTDSIGRLTTSQIIDADIAVNALINDMKLDTIRTLGKIANSALPVDLSGHSYNGLSFSSDAGGFLISSGVPMASLAVKSTLTLTGDPGSQLNIAGGGVLVASAFSDTTNASNIVSGILSDSRLPIALSGHSYNGLDLESFAVGFGILGGTTSKQLTVMNDIVLAGADGATVATLDTFGKLELSQLPDLAIIDFLGSVVSQSALLTIGVPPNGLPQGQKGDFCIRSDLGTFWIIIGEDQTILSNWIEMSYTGAAITSVAGRTGAIILTAADIGGLAPSATIDTTNASNITSGLLTNNRTTATNANTPSAIVLRDASGNFIAGTITASLNGNASTATFATTAGTAGDFTNALLGDVSGTQLATIVDYVGGQTAATIASGALRALAGTSLNTASTLIARDSLGNFTANIMTGSASNNVLKSGDTMTGTLQLPSGTLTAPSLCFTGSLTTGLSAIGSALSIITNGLERLVVDSSGIVQIASLDAVGILHSDASGTLTTSLIVDADIDASAGIVDSKLATITSAGKVANSATSATNSNVASSIVLRDALGSFSAGVITASLNGNASTSTSSLFATNATTAVNSTNFTGSLAGEVIGTQGATIVYSVDGQLAATISSGALRALAGTDVNTPLTLIARDGSGNFTAGIMTGSASNNVLKSGDIMTGTLEIPAGLITVPSLRFTGSTTTGLSAIADTLLILTGGSRRLTIDPTGIVRIFNLSSAGIVHNDATGNLSTSKIVDGDVDVSAAISDSKLATITTSGKVSNSATSATSSNVVSAIVLRDASGNFSANIITADLNGNASTATSAISFTGSLAGDVSGTQGSTQVDFVGGASSTDIFNATTAVINAMSTDVGSTLVVRDALGNFSAGNITADLTGSASNNVLKAGDTMTGALILPLGSLALPSLTFNGITGTGLSAVTNILSFSTNGVFRMSLNASGTLQVASLGGALAGIVHCDTSGNLSNSQIVNGDISAIAAISDSKLATITSGGKVANSATTATSANTASAIVMRDSSGNFSAGIITASLNGNASTATSATSATSATNATTAVSFSGSLAGDVTGTQGATVVSMVGSQTASAVASATIVVQNATSADTVSRLVIRDSSGNFATNMITIDGTVSNATDVATKSYVDAAVVSAIEPKTPALVVATSSITASGSQSVDGVSLTGGERVLLVAQSSAIQNGLWIVNGSGAWTRPTGTGDFQTGTAAGRAYILILSGTSNTGSAWLCNTPTAIIDIDPITFVQFSIPGATSDAANVGAGIGLFRDKIGNTLNFRSIITGTHLSIVNNGNDVTISTDATNLNTASTIVARDASGNFVAGIMTGSATNNVLKAGDTMSGSLLMDNHSELRLGDGNNYIALKAPTTITSGYTLQLPADAPTVRQKLVVDSIVASQLEWVTDSMSLAPSSSKVVYVSNLGNDTTGNGSEDFPYASLTKALATANSLSTLTNPIVIAMMPGVYTEDNSGGALSLMANGITIVGSSPYAVIIKPNTSNKPLLSIGKSCWIQNVQFNGGVGSTNDGVEVSGSTAQVAFSNVLITSFSTGMSVSSAMTLILSGCIFTLNATAISINSTPVSIKSCIIQGDGTLLTDGTTTGLTMIGTGAEVSFSAGIFTGHSIALSVNNSSVVAIDGTIFRRNLTSCSITGGRMNGTALEFVQNNLASNIVGILASGIGSVVRCSSAHFANLSLPTGTQIAVKVSDQAIATISGGTIENYTIAFQCGEVGDTSATLLRFKAMSSIGCTTDVDQRGTSTLLIQTSNIDKTKVLINDPTNVVASYFNASDNDAFSVGKFSDQETQLIMAETGAVENPHIMYWPNLYGYPSIGYHNESGNTALMACVGFNDNAVGSITTDRTKQASLFLYSDQGVSTGGTSALRGWTISKNASTAELSFSYQNSDTSGQITVVGYTVMQLDGLNNQLQLPATGTKVIFAGDTNLYRQSSAVLKTDGNLIVAGLTASRALISNASKQLTASSTTDVELGYVSGVTSSIQTQLNARLPLTGGTLTGTLTLPAGSISLPSLTFTGSSTTGFSASSDILTLSNAGTASITVSALGVVQFNAITSAGILHSDASGILSSSKIVDADVDASANISDTKLATISSAGKVSNSALPADLVRTTYNGLTLTALGTGFTIAGGATSKTFTLNNSIGLSGTDTAVLNVGAGGSLVASAFTDTTNASNISSGILSNLRIAAALSGHTYEGLSLAILTNGFTITGGNSKILKVDNTIELAGTDGSTLNIAGGGTLVASAFTDTTNASNITSGTLAVGQGGTGIGSYAVGDLLYASTTSVLSKLADIATGNALISGGIGVAPSYGKIGLATHISGTLGVGNGGTGQTSFTNGQLLIGNTTGNTLVKATLLSADTSVTITNGAGSIDLSVSASNISNGTLAVARGGTNISSYVTGDLLYASGTSTLARLAGAIVGQVLRSGGVGVAPAYGQVVLTTDVSGVLPVANGGTNISSYTTGDITYASGATTLSKLADVATGSALISGGVGVAPSYGKIGLTTHISGTLPVANGGTNLTSYATGDIITATGATTLASLADVATGNVLLSGGVNALPSYGKVDLTNHVTSVLPVANGGTNISSYAVGDLLYASASGTLSKLADVATGAVLASGGVGVAPAWKAMDYVYAYDTTTQSVSNANTFQDVTYGTNGNISGWTHTAGTASFTCVTAGTYSISACFEFNTTGGAAFGIESRAVNNGTEIAGSATYTDLNTNNRVYHVSNTFIVTCVATNVIKMQITAADTRGQIKTGNQAGTSNAGTKTSTSITITRIV